MAKFTKRDGQWVIETDQYHRTGDMVEVRTAKGVRTVKIGRELERPRGVQRRGSYVYAID
jgi:hypothetical protein